VILPAVLMLALAAPERGEVYVFEVPSEGSTLERQDGERGSQREAEATPAAEGQRTAVPAERGPLFFAAPFAVRRGRVVRGAWTPSDDILGPGWTRVVVVASWCPHCHTLLDSLSRERPQTAVILFQDDHSDRRGALANAASLERYPLAYHLLRPGSGLPHVTAFPTTFLCSRTRCTREVLGRR